MSQLKILRASAGSGKTYRITREYIQLLFKDKMNYRHILAVTFTNKATEEMKSRILRELQKLATGNSSSYLNFIMEEFKLTPDEIKKRADVLLKLILHDYSRFSIETIDSFFQRIIRSFIRELGIFSSFTIELDQSRMLQLGADELLEDIEENPGLKKWLLQFTEEKIKNGLSWRIGSNIENLGKEIFKEEYRYFESSISELLSDKGFLNKYLKKLSSIITNAEKDYAVFGKKAVEIIENHNLEIDDFSYREGGVAGFLAKIRNEFKEPGSRVMKALDDVEAWYKKSSTKKQEITRAFDAGLDRILSDAVNYYEQNINAYSTAASIRENIYMLGILNDLSVKIRQYAQEKNLFMLVDSAKLLNIIIANSDAPFVYEKIGSYFKHFMIDEFQDTSGMQWDNFRPLVSNSLAENNTSLVVGDVKQSIYRWRSGDWKLLAHYIENDFLAHGTAKESFENNWRSCPNIVDFNNSLFMGASQTLQDDFSNSLDSVGFSSDDENIRNEIVDAYADAVQLSPGNNQKGKKGSGKITCRFFKDDDWEEQGMKALVENIEVLQEKGYAAGDMAILVRTSKDGKKVANYLFERKNSDLAIPGCNYNFISDESLFVKSSLAVALIVAVLKHLVNPNEDLYRAQICHYSEVLKSAKSKNEQTGFPLLNSYSSDENLNAFFKEIPLIRNLSLFGITETVIRIFKLNQVKTNLPYLFAFQDMVFDFMHKEISGIRTFIDWWEEQGVKKSVSLDQEQDAIRLLTIHKSKGLEFKVVFVPFCNWDLDSGASKGNILWCKPQHKPFNELPIVPVKYSSKLEKSFFTKEYYNEKLHSYIDNINLLYVAFTRAKEVLVSYSQFSDKKKLNKISGLIYNTIAGDNSGILSSEKKQLI
ncbi:MAG: UvrD-helicase domain-containing protein, partial [Bacteroidota bacterium]|nr:UvrD-helicase domain-containing protein [Bacteroidota bacterium]